MSPSLELTSALSTNVCCPLLPAAVNTHTHTHTRLLVGDGAAPVLHFCFYIYFS